MFHLSMPSLPRRLCTLLLMVSSSLIAHEAEQPKLGQHSNGNTLPAQSTLPAPAAVQIDITKDIEVIRYTSQLDDSKWAIKNLFDGKHSADSGWSSDDKAEYPQKIVIKLKNRTQLTGVSINPQTSEDKGLWARDVVVEIGDTETGPWRVAALKRLVQKDEYQMLTVKPAFASYIRLIVESNFAGGRVVMGDVKVFTNGTTPEDILNSIQIFPGASSPN